MRKVYLSKNLLLKCDVLIWCFLVSPVTGKFYSRHEKDIDKGDPNDYYMELLTKAESLGPKNKFSSPQTESQR